MRKHFSNTLPDGSLRPILTGEQMSEIFAASRNRRPPMIQSANADRKLPPSVYVIEDVITPPTDLTGTRIFEIWIRRRGRLDVLVVYSRDSQPPQIGGLLERMSRPGGGVAAIWTDAGATKQSMGGGYTREALPADWGEPPEWEELAQKDLESSRAARLERARGQLDEMRRSLLPPTLETEAIKKAIQAGMVTASQTKANRMMGTSELRPAHSAPVDHVVFSSEGRSPAVFPPIVVKGDQS